MVHALFLLAYLLLFLLVFALLHASGYGLPHPIGGLDLLLLCMATFRLTELITEDKVFQFLRAPFVTVKTVHVRGGGKTIEEKPAGRGVRRVIGELLLCPWCAGLWIATLLTFAYMRFPDVAYVLLLIMSVAAGGVLLQIVGKFVDEARQEDP